MTRRGNDGCRLNRPMPAPGGRLRLQRDALGRRAGPLRRVPRALRRAGPATHRGGLLRHARRPLGGGDHRHVARRRRRRARDVSSSSGSSATSRCRGRGDDRRTRCAKPSPTRPNGSRSQSSPARSGGRSSRCSPGRTSTRHVTVVVAADDVERGKPASRRVPAGAEPARRRAPGRRRRRVRGHRGRGRLREGRRAALRRACSARYPPERLAAADELVDALDRRRLAGSSRVTLVIAHRGACWELPENTLAAFERAIEVGADFVEFDVHATSDGELVVCHDRPLRRRAPPRGGGRGAGGADRGHVRAQDARGATAATTSSRAASRCCPRTQSCSLRRAGVARPCAGRRVLQHVGFGVSIQRAARYAWGVGLPRPPRHAARARTRPARSGSSTTVYTVNDAERMRELAALGVDGIFSDRPDLLRQALAAPRG